MIERQFGLFAPLLLLLTIAGLGCRREAVPPGGRTAPTPNSPALYGAPSGKSSSAIERLRPYSTKEAAWRTAPFYVLETELSPATLIHSSTKYLGLFTGMTNRGLGSPMYGAWTTKNGPRSFKRGEALDVKSMDENWVLVWWAGAEGWTNWDSPWVVYLQHKPSAMALDQDGLHLDFPTSAGDVVLLPLYGYEKLPTKEFDFRKAHGLPDRKTKLEPWKWPAGLLRDPLTRIRYWAAATREFPISCEESISVDRAADSVSIRSSFSWYSIEDDWQTRHLKLAPLSPPLAHTLKEGGFPVTVSEQWLDLDLFTPYGPYFAIEGVDSFDTTLSVLQYVNETEAAVAPDTNATSTVLPALEKLRATGREKFPDATRTLHDQLDLNDLRRAIQDAHWSAKALPYYDDVTRTNALASLRKYFSEQVLVRSITQEISKGSGRAHLVLKDPKANSRDEPDVNASVLETLWAYAHFTGDWDLIRERWPLVKSLFTMPARTRWVGFGSDGIVAIGDQAAPCAAFARMAYRAGDLDAYHYGCSMFARELVHLFLKQRGAEYFRRHQPCHSMEFMGDEIFLTDLRDDIGWRLDGPTYPGAASERQFHHRWVRFNDFDVARFHRDYLQDDARRELTWLQGHGEATRKWQNDPAPSLVQLRSLLLNESPAELAALASVGQFSGPPVIANCLSLLRTSRPTRYERLIPGGAPSPFVAGLERDVASPKASLLTTVQHSETTTVSGTTNAIWPQLTWPGWKTPAGARWNFGQITPVRKGVPKEIEVLPLNWNTRAFVFRLPNQ